MEPRSGKLSDTNNGCNAMYSGKEVLRAQSPPSARHALATSSRPACDLVGKAPASPVSGRHEENKQELSSSAGGEDEAEKEEGVRFSEEEVEEEEVFEVKNTRSGKRKLSANNTSTAILTRGKSQQQNQISYNRSKKNSGKNNVEIWSATRYKLAEENILKIMQAKGAVFGKPILRPALRSEARKLIGDTGLLDHLLKHMAEKLAPGGVETFRRRHNADGAMEYWLESADLIEIRKKAGVQDPYWTPPPGWKLGDNPTQDPREEMVKMKRDMSKKEEELKAAREEIAELKAHLQAQELASVANLKSKITDLQWGQHGSFSLLPLKKRHMELLNRKTKFEENLMEVSGYWSVMEPLQCGPSPVSPPIKPLAEKGHVKPATLSSVLKGSLSAFPPPPPETSNSQSNTTTDSSLINLTQH